MFSIPTVFILGAGASWHYGYLLLGSTVLPKNIGRHVLVGSLISRVMQLSNDAQARIACTSRQAQHKESISIGEYRCR
jgi:hypothetical protein